MVGVGVDIELNNDSSVSSRLSKDFGAIVGMGVCKGANKSGNVGVELSKNSDVGTGLNKDSGVGIDMGSRKGTNKGSDVEKSIWIVLVEP